MIFTRPRLRLGRTSQRLLMINVIFIATLCVQSGNVISMENAGGNHPNMTHIHPMTVSQVDGDLSDSDSAWTQWF